MLTVCLHYATKPSRKSVPVTELHQETLRIWNNDSSVILSASIDKGFDEWLYY